MSDRVIVAGDAMRNSASRFDPANSSKVSIFHLKVLSVILGSRGVLFKPWKRLKIVP